MILDRFGKIFLTKWSNLNVSLGVQDFLSKVALSIYLTANLQLWKIWRKQRFVRIRGYFSVIKFLLFQSLSQGGLLVTKQLILWSVSNSISWCLVQVVCTFILQLLFLRAVDWVLPCYHTLSGCFAWSKVGGHTMILVGDYVKIYDQGIVVRLVLNRENFGIFFRFWQWFWFKILWGGIAKLFFHFNREALLLLSWSLLRSRYYIWWVVCTVDVVQLHIANLGITYLFLLIRIVFARDMCLLVDSYFVFAWSNYERLKVN